jgi:hypothetical protein
MSKLKGDEVVVMRGDAIVTYSDELFKVAMIGGNAVTMDCAQVRSILASVPAARQSGATALRIVNARFDVVTVPIADVEDLLATVLMLTKHSDCV